LPGRHRPRRQARRAYAKESEHGTHQPVNPQTAQGRAKELLDAVKAKLGLVPNMTRAMALSPPVLDAYPACSGAPSG
jgi:hypothetical protein